MSRTWMVLGLSHRIMAPALLYVALCGLVLPLGVQELRIPQAVFCGPQTVGVLFLFWGAWLVRKGWKEMERLFFAGSLTDPLEYARTRKPVYVGWILFILPGLAFLCRSLPMLLAAPIAWFLCRLYVGRVEGDLWHYLLCSWKIYHLKMRLFPPVKQVAREVTWMRISHYDSFVKPGAKPVNGISPVPPPKEPPQVPPKTVERASEPVKPRQQSSVHEQSHSTRLGRAKRVFYGRSPGFLGRTSRFGMQKPSSRTRSRNSCH